MTLWQPQHRRSRRSPLYLRLGALTLAPVAAVGAYLVVTDETPSSSDTVSAEVDSTTHSTYPATPDPTPSTTSEAPVPGESPANEPSSEPSGEPTPPPGDTGTPGRPDSSPSSPPEDPAEDPPEDPTGTPPVNRPPSTGEPEPSEPDEPEPSEPDEPPSDPSDPSEPTEPPDDPSHDPVEPPPPEPTVPTVPTVPQPPVPELTGAELELVEATNAERARAGCPDLEVDGALMSAAREHSADMRRRKYLSHVSPDGSTPEDRAAAAGFDGAVDEAIRYPTSDAERVVDRWMSDPQDRSKLLDCSYTSIGVGRESWLLGSWWTQVLGRD